MSSMPPATYSLNGFERSYMAWPATEAMVQRWPGCMAVTSTCPGVISPSTVSLAP
jgi:hypothetical protein